MRRSAAFGFVILALPFAGCSSDDPSALAAKCARASPQPRVQHLASLMVDAQITVTETRVETVALVPVGIGFDARPKFRELRYACQRSSEESGGELSFESFAVTQAKRP